MERSQDDVNHSRSTAAQLLRGMIAGAAGGMAAVFVVDQLRHVLGIKPHGFSTSQTNGSYGEAQRYGLGAAGGALYGLATEYSKSAPRGFNGLVGTALFLGTSRILRQSAAAPQQPAAADGLVYPQLSRLAYGLTAEAVRRGVRSVL